jgi:monovalent cation:proton antiporter-2 (CPA2) family protein
VASTVHIPYLTEVLAFLVAAVVIVPLCRRLGVSPVLGYLVGGIAAGPSLLGLVDDVDRVRVVAELGVLFLLFTVGLELSFERLRTFAQTIFGLGTAQVIASAVFIGLVAWGWGNALQAAILIGLALALSSTAMVLQLLAERGQLAARHGRVSLAVLLFQDLAVVPILMLVSVFGSDTTGTALWIEVAGVLVKAVLAVALILVVGHFVLRRLFHVVTRARSHEVFVAMALLSILVTSWLTGLAGLSMALGAFLAGLLLADSEFRHQIETDIEPFKGLLLGLFFMAVGMAIDLGAVHDRLILIVLSVGGLMAGKAAIVFGLCRAFRLPASVSARAAILLSEAGEFAFIIIGAATLQYALIPPAVGQFMVIVVGLSMAVAPFLAMLADRVGNALEARESLATDSALAGLPTDNLSGHILIAGFGRVGQTVARLLKESGVPYVAIDADSTHTRTSRAAGEPVVFGDATRAEVLGRLGAERAAAIVLTLDAPASVARSITAIRQRWPSVRIFTRARDVAHADDMRALGADDVVPEALESSLQLSGLVLRATGVTPDAANLLIERIRQRAYQGFREVPPPSPAAGTAGPTEPPPPAA